MKLIEAQSPVAYAPHHQKGDTNPMEVPSIRRRASLYRFITSRLNQDLVLPDPRMSLPDEPRPDPANIAFVAGAKDGAFGHHFGGGQNTDLGARAAALLSRAAQKPSRRHLRRLYEALLEASALDYVDPLIEQLAHTRPPTEGIAAIGTWLATSSPDREPVKIGLSLLGITGAPDGAILHGLGAHEEFTLFAAVAFVNSRADPEPDLFTLAQSVDGWGRIQCVERLASTTNPEIQSWILREGFRNTVMDEYLAYTAATTGDLVSALIGPDVDRELLTAAGDILAALIAGGPAEDIDDYDDAPVAIDRFLGHMTSSAETVADLAAIADVAELLRSDAGWEKRLAANWDEYRRAELLAQCEEILAWGRWPEVVSTALGASDQKTSRLADRGARSLGIDTFWHHLRSIDHAPLGSSWLGAWELTHDDDRALLLARRAADLIDLDTIATGPTRAVGLGPEFRQHAALGWNLQGIARFPGIGSDLVRAGLSSGSIQNRNGAMTVLESWGPSHWSRDHVAALGRLASADPHSNTRLRAIELLRIAPAGP